MCIHVAAPFHSTVNYLQNFYHAFVAAKPLSLCTPPPTSLQQLRGFTERELVKVLPMGRQRQWLLASQIPRLLSFRVGEERSLLNFAQSQWHVYEKKKEAGEITIRDISESFYYDLMELAKQFYENSRAMDRNAIPYMVMNPDDTAVSVLIWDSSC